MKATRFVFIVVITLNSSLRLSCRCSALLIIVFCRWQSLAQFVQYLGKEGKIIAEETPKGWYITYIDRDPEVMARQVLDAIVFVHLAMCV